MAQKSKVNEMPLRGATEHDIPQLAIHHRKMFEEIWDKKGEHITHSACNEMEEAYSRKLIEELINGSCRAWVIEKKGQILASGAITIVHFVPMPNDHSSNVAYLHSMYTEKGYRNHNFASRIVKEALGYCKANGIRRVILHASDAGKPIYEKMGFRSSPETMSMFIE